MDKMEIGGKTYVAEEPLGVIPNSNCSECRGCAFNTDELLKICGDLSSCCAGERDDGRDIIWVEEKE